jgi:hypothetical protein
MFIFIVFVVEGFIVENEVYSITCSFVKNRSWVHELQSSSHLDRSVMLMAAILRIRGGTRCLEYLLWDYCVCLSIAM